MLVFLAVKFRPDLAILPVADITTIAEGRALISLIPWSVASSSSAIVIFARCLVHPYAFRRCFSSLWVDVFIVFWMNGYASQVC